MKTNERYTSIVIASYIADELRAKMFRTSLDSLLATTENLPVEIIVVDNGGDLHISGYLDGLLLGGAIQCVIHNANNMHFGFARNQGLAMAKGNYICIADNDIYYEDGWLEDSLDFLEKYPEEKVYASFIDYPMGGLTERYHQGVLGDAKLSMRAGSNCWVMRKRDFDILGGFENHRVAGTRWTDNAVRNGYLCAVLPGQKTRDLGLRQGYDHTKSLPVKRTLRNGEEVYFNQDEFEIPS
jgi:glycosyltransferase involved in cell wall biosynthesis